MARRTALSALWSSLVDILRRWFGARTTRALPAPAHAIEQVVWKRDCGSTRPSGWRIELRWTTHAFAPPPNCG